ncbi:MAG: efflux RND transporter periplasmic adaptor subunit [Phycisphaerales bacterium]
MNTFASRALRALLRGLPTVLTLALLVAIAYVGHRYHWKLPSRAALTATVPTHDNWCMEHGVPESECMICRGKKPVPDAEGSSVSAGTTGEKPADAKLQIVQLATPDSAAKAGITTAPAESRPVTSMLSANAEVGYDLTRYAQVSSRASGSVAMVRVNAGDRVKAGDVLALIDSAIVGAAKAELLQSASQVASRSASLERIRTSTSAGFRNQSELLSAEAEVKEAQIRLFNAQQALVNLGLGIPASIAGGVPTPDDVRLLGIPRDLAAQLDPARSTANLLPVIAPLDGVVISRSIVPGEAVEAGKPVLAVADTSRVWVNIAVPPADAGRVALGQEVRFTPDGSAEPPVVGRVTWISTEVDEKTRTVRVRAEFPNPDGRLLAHCFGRAAIVTRQREGAVVVPREAVQWDTSGALVFVRVNSTVFAARNVTTGAIDQGFIEILAGVRPGERVATGGSYVLAAQLNHEKLGAGCTDD